MEILDRNAMIVILPGGHYRPSRVDRTHGACSSKPEPFPLGSSNADGRYLSANLVDDDPAMVKVVGIDGSAKRWAIVSLVDGRFAEASIAESLTPPPVICSEALTIGIDIPLTSPDTGKRSAESEARRLLTGRSSSVFSTPPADVLAEPTYQEALALARRVYGYGISAQAYALRHAIADARLSGLHLHEVHPELSFTRMNGGPGLAKKKSWAGLQQRLELLSREGIVLPADPGPVGQVPPDDLLDACAAAWTAGRIASGQAENVGDESGGYIWI